MKQTEVYEVTKEGKVYSVSSNWRGYGKRELKQIINSRGYPSVRLMVDGVRKRFSVHSLVAKKYLPYDTTLNFQVRHLDGNKCNNNVSNLAWGTAKQNADDRQMHGKTSSGLKHSIAIKNGIYGKRL